MEISLPSNIEKILNDKVAEGIFSTPEEAITFAIQFAIIDSDITPEKLAKLNSEIEFGWKEMEAGEGRCCEETFTDLRKRYA